jgi:hypothetical protein
MATSGHLFDARAKLAHQIASHFFFLRQKITEPYMDSWVGEIFSRKIFLGHSFFTRICKSKLCVFSGLCLAKRVRA